MTVQTPPPPHKEAIDKCVQYVVKNGPQFADKLLASKESAQFSFLLETGQFHDYYSQQLQLQHCLQKERRQDSGQDDRPQQEPSAEPAPAVPPKLAFLTDLPPVSAHDLHIIKAVALYTACNSEQHLRRFGELCRKLASRKQYAFLDEGHSLHGLLRSYIEQYRHLVARARGGGPDKAIDSCLGSQHELFENAYRRAAYHKRNHINQRLRHEDDQRRQYLYASIDWQDFQLVERVHFDAIDEVSELARPLLRSTVALRLLEMKNRFYKAVEEEYERGKNQDDNSKGRNRNDKNESDKNDKNNDSNENEPTSSDNQFVPKGIKIKAAGESRLKRKKQAERLITCPLTEQAIPESQFDAHLKVLLLDPKYKEQQENYMKKNFRYESNLTSDQVYENIKQLVRRQTDERPAKRLK